MLTRRLISPSMIAFAFSMFEASSSHVIIKIFGGCIYFNAFVFLVGFKE